jgi:hypothetical protein
MKKEENLMKCSKCNKEIDDGSAFCAFCGAEVKATEDKVEEVVSQEEVKEQVQEEKQEVVEEKKEEVVKEEVKQTVAESAKANATKGKNRHSVITIVILGAVVALVIVVALIACLVFSKSSEKLFKDAIKSALTSAYSGEAVTATSANINASVELSTNIDDLKDAVDGLKVESNVQYDLENKQFVVGLNLDKKKDSYLAANAMVDLSNNTAYLSETNLFSKVVKAEIPEDLQDEIKEILGDDESLEVDAAASKKASKKIYSAIDKNLSKELFNREKVTVNINGKDKKVKDNSLSISSSDFKVLVENVAKTLKLDNDFLACFSDRSQILSALDDLEDSVEDFDDLDSVFTIHYFTTGISNKFVGLSIIVTDDYGNEEVVEIINTSKNVYEVNVIESTYYGSQETLLTANVTINKSTKKEKDVTISMEIEDEGRLELNIQTSATYNKGIDAMDVSSAVDYTELTSDDFEEIYNNFKNSKLYEEFSGYIEDVTSSLGLDDEILSSTQRDVPAGITLKNGQSFVESYDDDVIVFDVPTSFEEEYSGLSYQRFSKEDKTKETAYIDVDCNWDSLKDYESSIESLASYYTEESGYQDVKLSDREEVKVGDNTFYKKTFQYTYKSGSYSYTSKRTYYYLPITDEYVYSIEIDDEDGIVTDKEVEKLLTVEVTLSK